MTGELPTAPSTIRLATPKDIALIEELDTFSTSPTRHISRELHKYFGSVDPSIHERTLIFLLEVGGVAAAKAELMLPPSVPTAINDEDGPTQPDDRESQLYFAGAIGYVRRVVVHPDY